MEEKNNMAETLLEQLTGTHTHTYINKKKKLKDLPSAIFSSYAKHSGPKK